MSHRTISMNAPMFLALLGGTKTQTRRIMKPQPSDSHWEPVEPVLWGSEDSSYPINSDDALSMCPYGVPGDILTVRGSNVALEIVSIRVERLNHISEEDARAEGVTAHDMYNADGLAFADGCTHKATFSNLWKSIYGAGAWAENPYVWVVEFKLVKS